MDRGEKITSPFKKLMGLGKENINECNNCDSLTSNDFGLCKKCNRIYEKGWSSGYSSGFQEGHNELIETLRKFIDILKANRFKMPDGKNVKKNN